MKKLNLSSIGLIGAIIMFIAILCSCGSLKIAPGLEISPKAQSIIAVNGLAYSASEFISPETKKPRKAKQIIWGAAITYSFGTTIFDRKRINNLRWKNSLIRK